MHQREIWLDAKDRELLRVIESHARLTNRELARRISLSESACLERLRRLERAGTIRGYQAILSPLVRKDGFHGWLAISLADINVAQASACKQLLVDSGVVIQCFQVSGMCDLLAQIGAEEKGALAQFLANLKQVGIGDDRLRICTSLDVLKPVP